MNPPPYERFPPVKDELGGIRPSGAQRWGWEGHRPARIGPDGDEIRYARHDILAFGAFLTSSVAASVLLPAIRESGIGRTWGLVGAWLASVILIERLYSLTFWTVWPLPALTCLGVPTLTYFFGWAPVPGVLLGAVFLYSWARAWFLDLF